MGQARPEIDSDLCTLCGECILVCPHGAVSIVEGRLILDDELCSYCAACEDVCPMGAIGLPFEIVILKEGPEENA